MASTLAAQLQSRVHLTAAYCSRCMLCHSLLYDDEEPTLNLRPSAVRCMPQEPGTSGRTDFTAWTNEELKVSIALP